MTGATAVAAPTTPTLLLQAGNDADLAHLPARAYEFYRLAAEGGLAEAEFNVAVMADSGVGTEHDAAQAALWYGRAAAHGFIRAFYNLGELATAGDGMPRNPALARAWFDAAGAFTRSRALASEIDLRALPSSPDLSEVQIDPPTDDGMVPVEFVWTVAAMPGDTEFFVQVVRLDAGGPHAVAWTATPVAALILPLSRRPDVYAWRVLASSASSGHYAASRWASFQVRTPAITAAAASR